MKDRQRKEGLLRVLLTNVLWLGMLSCISEYEPKGIDMIRDLLVVDGIITNGETVINLRKSVGLTDDFTKDEFVNNAEVTVERADGALYPGTLASDKGEYKIATGDLDATQSYRLRVSLDGREYESDYLRPVITPAIDTVSLQKKGQGADVNLCVSTHNDAEGSSRYYRWTYKEDWELKAEMFMQAERIGNSIHEYDLATSNNAYYCWGKDSTKIIQLGTSDKLTSNVIVNKKLVTMNPGNDRLSILYHVEVEQYALRAEAYDYYYNLQKNIEATGGLFTPIPSEMKGNIRCVSDPDIPVIGYVEVSTVSRIKQYMPGIKDLFEPKSYYCDLITGDKVSDFLNNSDYAFLSYNPSDIRSSSLARKECLDCRRRGTKNKPSWWPTTHL